jgi:nicotinate phosphoribosyltransferase
VQNFKFSDSDITYLKSIMPTCAPEFFDWLQQLDCSRTQIYAMKEGSIVFPREPLLRIEGPLAVGQLLETTLLNLTNYPSLIATNAARM